MAVRKNKIKRAILKRKRERTEDGRESGPTVGQRKKKKKLIECEKNQ